MRQATPEPVAEELERMIAVAIRSIMVRGEATSMLAFFRNGRRRFTAFGVDHDVLADGSYSWDWLPPIIQMANADMLVWLGDTWVLSPLTEEEAAAIQSGEAPKASEDPRSRSEITAFAAVAQRAEDGSRAVAEAGGTRLPWHLDDKGKPVFGQPERITLDTGPQVWALRLGLLAPRKDQPGQAIEALLARGCQVMDAHGRTYLPTPKPDTPPEPE